MQYRNSYSSPTRIILILLLNLCLQAVSAAAVPSSVRSEWQEAVAFLEGMGKRAENLQVVYSSPQCVYFAAPKDEVFVMVARYKYKEALGSPVLAYGTGNEVWTKSPDEEDPVEQDGFFLKMIAGYESTLKALDESPVPVVALEKKNDVQPLCADINYGQHLPFNKLFPMDGEGDNAWYSVVGCGPVALAQVLTYYKSPVQPKGVVSGTTAHGNPYTYDMAEYPVDWDNLKPEALLLDCALSLGTILSVGASHTLISQFKAALFDTWGYSPRCKLLGNVLGEKEMLSMVRSDIAAGHPVILAGNNHLFVCDGIQGDFLHFDFGWRGFGNGYFRTLLLPSAPEWQLPFLQALVGVEPDSPARYKDVTVKLSKAGTLAKKLKKDAPYIRKLTIKGPVNGADFDLIRHMAGAVIMPKDYQNEYGALTELDLTDARIVATAPFHIKNNKLPIHGTITPQNSPAYDYYFKLDEVTKKDWEEIVRLGLDKTYGLDMVDGIVLFKYATWDDTIPTYLFSDCIALRKVALPKKLKKVDKLAFFECKGLVEVTNLPKDVHPEAFLSSSYR